MRGFIFLSFIVFYFGCKSPRVLNEQALMHQSACVKSIEEEDYANAKIRCELCLEYDNAMVECTNGLGIVAYASHEKSKAIQYFTKAINQNKDFAQARNNLGAVYFQDEKWEEASTLFLAAVQIDPGYEDARYNLALTHLRLGQKAYGKKLMQSAKGYFEKSKEQYEKLLGVSAQHANANRDLGLIWNYLASMENLDKKREFQLEKAAAYLERCLEIEPLHETCHQTLGYVNMAQAQYEKALYHFGQCLTVHKNNTECIRGTDEAYQRSEIKSKALNQFVEQLKKNPQDALAHYGYCKILMEKGMYDLAVLECENALNINPVLCEAQFQLAIYYEKASLLKQATEQCRKFLLCPSSKDKNHQKDKCEQIILKKR